MWKIDAALALWMIVLALIPPHRVYPDTLLAVSAGVLAGLAVWDYNDR